MQLVEFRCVVGVHVGDACRTKDVDAFFVLLVRVLERLQPNGSCGEQNGHDHNQDGGIQEDITVAVDVFLHFAEAFEVTKVRF